MPFWYLGHETVSNILLKSEIDVNQKGKKHEMHKGETALELAIDNGTFGIYFEDKTFKWSWIYRIE